MPVGSIIGPRILTSRSGDEKWPCAYEIQRNFTVTNAEVGALVYKVDVEGMSLEDVAMGWAQENEATWREWAACAAS